MDGNLRAGGGGMTSHVNHGHANKFKSTTTLLRQDSPSEQGKIISVLQAFRNVMFKYVNETIN